MCKVTAGSAAHPDFVRLTQQADDEYYQIYGDVAPAYRGHNKLDALCVCMEKTLDARRRSVVTAACRPRCNFT